MNIVGVKETTSTLYNRNQIKMEKLLFFCVTLVLISLSWARTTPNATEQTTISVTTLSPEEECKRHHASCDDCVGVAKAQCVYCQASKTCKLKKSIIPTDECALSDAKWGVCWVNYQALIIAVSVIGGVIVVGIMICCCCCCRGKGKEKLKRWEAKWERDRAERKAKNDERRAERQQKTDEIRRKYVIFNAKSGQSVDGLVKDDAPYTRFQ